MGHAKPKDIIAEKVNKLHRSISTYKKITLDSMIECGKLLYEEKRKHLEKFIEVIEK